MSDIELGKLIESNDAQRDAIHVAVAPVMASEKLYPGQQVRLCDGCQDRVEAATDGVGIIDPFLKHAVEPGDRCYLWLTPNTVTGMRHHWQHPEFLEGEERASVERHIAVQWLRNFAAEVGIGYETLMDGASDWIKYGDYLNCGGILEGESVPTEFWDHYQKATGEFVNDENRMSFFTCSC